jgi:hypothetical protein
MQTVVCYPERMLMRLRILTNRVMPNRLALVVLVGLIVGGSLTSVTPAQASSRPSEVQAEPAEVTAKGAVLKGKLNPGGLPTTYYFEYARTICDEGCTPQKTAVAGPLNGGSQQEVPPIEVTGLEPGGRYWYQLVATNTDGTTEGGFLEFTAPKPKPAIEYVSVGNVTLNDARLYAGIRTEGLESGAYYQFQVVADPSEYPPEIACPVSEHSGLGGGGCTAAPTPGALPIESAPELTAMYAAGVSVNLASAGMTLQPGTTYHYRVIAATARASEDQLEWEHPPVYSADETFTTPAAAAPSIEGESVSHVTSTDATLEASINPQDAERTATYQFQLVVDPSEYLSVFACPAGRAKTLECIFSNVDRKAEGLPLSETADGMVGQAVGLNLASASVTLSPGTTYHYRVITARPVQGEEGPFWPGPFVEGPDQTFTTPARPNPSGGGKTPSGADSHDQPGTSGRSAHSGVSSGPGPAPPGAPPPGKTVKPRPLTRAEKLAKALKACRGKPRRQRARCARRAHRRYGR